MVENIIIVLVIAVIGYAAYKMFFKKKSVADAMKETVSDIKSAADVNGDGKVDVADVKAAATKAKTAAKKTAKRVTKKKAT